MAYAKKKGGKPVGFIDIDHVSQFQSLPNTDEKYMFNLVTARRTFFLYSTELDEKLSWINAIKCNISYHYAKDPAVIELAR